MTVLDALLIGPPLAAFLLVGIRGTVVILQGVSSSKSKQSVRLTDAVGPCNWDFSKSFASSITVLGALLTTVLAAKVPLASPSHVSAGDYAALSLFFGVLVVVAPLSFRALSTPRDVINVKGLPAPAHGRDEERSAEKAPAGATDGAGSGNAGDNDLTNDVQYQGHMFGFLLATFFTVWAVYGQLGTIIAFVTDVQSSQVLIWMFALQRNQLAHFLFQQGH